MRIRLEQHDLSPSPWVIAHRGRAGAAESAPLRLLRVPLGLVAELPSNLARGLSGRRDFGPRMGGTLSTLSTHSTLTTRASIVTCRFINRIKAADFNEV